MTFFTKALVPLVLFVICSIVVCIRELCRKLKQYFLVIVKQLVQWNTIGLAVLISGWCTCSLNNWQFPFWCIQDVSHRCNRISSLISLKKSSHTGRKTLKMCPFNRHLEPCIPRFTFGNVLIDVDVSCALELFGKWCSVLGKYRCIFVPLYKGECYVPKSTKIKHQRQWETLSGKKKFLPVMWIKLWQNAMFAWHPRMHSCVCKVSQNAPCLAPLAADPHVNGELYTISRFLSVGP